MNLFTFLFVAVVLAQIMVEWWLSQRHITHIQAHRQAVPEAFSKTIPLSAHQRAADYTVICTRFRQYELLFGTLLLFLWTLGGGLDLLDTFWRGLELPPLGAGTAFMLSVFIVMALLDIPLSAYRTFVIEQRFGFNRTTPRMFFMDLLKQGLLLLVLGTPLISLVLWLMDSTGPLWWVYVWVAWSGFSILMMWIYPTFIAPLFNKFDPLRDESLRHRIEALLGRNGFSNKGIFVMDGSLRSTHGNAYFTGFGAAKRIVFFDTLLAGFDAEEIESVLAHELGHFKRKHILKQMVLMAGLSFVGFAVLGWLIDRLWFYQGLGISTPSTHVALVLFLMVAPVFSFLLQPVLAAISRKYEFEADDFAAEQADGRSLIRALVKLYKDNASTLTPDPWYSAFHDSHPPAPLRVAHLAAKGGTR
jgi:STE24 endopeptidase